MVFSTLKKNHISGHWSRALSSWACISSSFLFRSTHVPWFSRVISPHDNWQQFITHVGSLHFFFCCDPQYSMLSRTTKQLASTSHYPLVSCLILQYFISWLSEKSLSRDPITEAIKQKLWLRSPNQHTLSTHKLSPGPCRELTKPDSDTASPWPGFQRMSSCRWLNTSWQATDPFSFPRMITLRPKLFAERQVILVSSLQAPSELLMIQ